MNLLDLMVKIGVDDQASSKIAGIAGDVKSGLVGAAKYGVMALGAVTTAAGAGAVAIGKQALEAYASYEQLAGGVEKLFGDASDTVMQNAQQAYMTAGMSANQYMEQATGFSAALIQSLGGDTEEAAHLADEAMRAMSDNVNVFGSNMQDVQNAYQGFAKQNYTMLDNLKLGYGGTKEEMQRLIQDAAACTDAQEKLGLSVDANSMSFDNIVKAIQVVQYEQGIWGTTAEEASKTVEGSINMTKAAWQNFLTEMGKPIDEADLAGRMQELIDSATTVIENVTPVIQRIIAALVAAAPQLVPAALELGAAIIKGIAEGIMQAVPGLSDFMQSDLVSGLVEAWSPVIDKLREIGDTLAPYVQPALEQLWQVVQDALIPALERLGEAVTYFLEQFEPWAPHLMNVATILGEVFIISVAAAIDIIAALVNIVGTIMQALMAFCDFVESIPSLIQGAIDQVGQFFSNMRDKIATALESIMSKAREWASNVSNSASQMESNVVNFVTNMASNAISAVASMISQFVNWVSSGVSEVVSWFSQLPGMVVSALSSLAGYLLSIASDAMSSMASGVSNGVSNVLSFFYDIPWQIYSALSGIGGLLWDAGYSVLMGFYDGAVSAWNSMVGWLSNIGGWIQNLKGPLDYDKKLLIENGQAIMQGLQKGLEEGYADVERTVAGMAPDISTSMQVSSTMQNTSNGVASEIAAIREELKNMRLVLSIDGRAFAEATVGEMDRAMGSMARRAVAR